MTVPISSAPALRARLDRDRIHAILDRGAALALVVGPPGSGRRTAVRSWLEARGLDATWLPATAGAFDPSTLPRGDGDSPRLLVLDASSGDLAPGAVALAATGLDRADPLPRVVLIADRVPDLPLGRHRAAGRVAEIGFDDLRFTAGEAAALLALRAGAAPPEVAAARVMDATDGWAIGVEALAAALAERDASSPGEAWVERGLGWIAGFVREEVLAPLPPAERRLLARTAPLDRWDRGDAAIALAGGPGEEDAGGVVDRLTAAGLLEPAGMPGAVAARAMLRPCLRQAFERELPPEEAGRLRSAFAATRVGAGRIEEAVGLLLDAGRTEDAAAALAAAMDRLLAHEDWPRLERLLARFPARDLDTSPDLLAARCWLAHLSGRFAALPDLAARIAELDAALPPDDPGREARAALGEMLSLTSLVALERDPAAGLARLAHIRRHVPAANRLGLGIVEKSEALALHALGRTDEAVRNLTDAAAREAEHADAAFARPLQALAFVHWQAGNLDACHSAAEDLLRLAQERDLPLAAGWARRFLGRLAWERDRPEEAAGHFSAALADPRAHRSALAECAAGLALAHAAAGRPAEGVEAAAGAAREAATARAVHLSAMLRAAERLVAVRAGLAAAGAALAETGGAALDQASLHTQVHPVAARIELLIRDGSPAALAEAATRLDAYRQRAVACRHLPATVQADLLGAALADRQGDRESARAQLERAADLGIPAGLRRTFVDLGPLLRPLAGEVRVGSDIDDRLARAAALLAVAPRQATPPPRHAARPSPLEVLTVRETEVLHLLARRLTYKEIGQALSISPGTVKFHLRAIYGKLGVGGRREAILRAGDLGWALAPPDAGASEPRTG